VNFTPSTRKQKEKVHEAMNSPLNQNKKINDVDKTKSSIIVSFHPKGAKFVKNNSNGRTFLDVAKRFRRKTSGAMKTGYWKKKVKSCHLKRKRT
jgi:thiamine biosynthesis lipoprotein ApbE